MEKELRNIGERPAARGVLDDRGYSLARPAARRVFDDRGYSLVELIVVVLIMAILAGGSTAAVSALRSASASQAAGKLTAEFAYARRLAMTASEFGGASSVTLALFKDGDDYYAEVRRGASVEESVKLGSDRITIKAGPAGSQEATCPVTLGDGTPELVFSFDRRAGGIASTEPGGSGSGKYLDIFITGSETVHVIIAEYTGQTFLAT